MDMSITRLSVEAYESWVLSVVMMTSAFLLLPAQKNSWTDAYVYENGAYVLAEKADLFTNGFRYLYWLIDVPMLLIQILFVAGIVGAARRSYMVRFAFAGVLMIVTGYIGQFFEPGRTNENFIAWAVWGFLSTLFFFWVLILITRVIREGAAKCTSSCRRVIVEVELCLFFDHSLTGVSTPRR